MDQPRIINKQIGSAENVLPVKYTSADNYSPWIYLG
jgi:hypothetical protein